MARTRRFPKPPKVETPPIKWEDSPDIRQAAATLMAKHEVHFNDLRQLRIGYLMIVGGKEPKRDRIDGVWARFMKVPEPYRTLTELDAVLWVRQAIWKTLNDAQRSALVAHQLTHGSTNDKGDLVIVRHDLEDFAWVARHFGAWYENVELYGKQLSLFGTPDAKPANGKADDAFADIDATVAEQKAERTEPTQLRPRSTSTDQPTA